VASRGSSHVLDPTAPTRRSALFGGREARPVTATALSIWHTWRLTSGERVLALPGGKPSAAPGRATHHTGPESLVASSFPEQDPDPAARHAGGPTAEPRPAPERTELPGSRTWTEGRATVRACLVGGCAGRARRRGHCAPRHRRSAARPGPAGGGPTTPRRLAVRRAELGLVTPDARHPPHFRTGLPASLPDPCGVGLMPRPPQQEGLWSGRMELSHQFPHPGSCCPNGLPTRFMRSRKASGREGPGRHHPDLGLWGWHRDHRAAMASPASRLSGTRQALVLATYLMSWTPTALLLPVPPPTPAPIVPVLRMLTNLPTRQDVAPLPVSQTALSLPLM
jgi:hypothetical protein